MWAQRLEAAHLASASAYTAAAPSGRPLCGCSAAATPAITGPAGPAAPPPPRGLHSSTSQINLSRL